MEKGILVDPSISTDIEKLSERHLEFILSLKIKPVVINKEYLNSVIEPKIKIKSSKSERTSIQDFINRYYNRYKFIQNLLVGNSELNNLVSIRNANGHVSVIGMVKEFDAEKLIIEDLTGEIEIKLSESRQFLIDEVIGVNGFAGSGKITPEKIIYPDVFKNLKKSRLPGIAMFSLGEINDIKNATHVISKKELKQTNEVCHLVVNDTIGFEINDIFFIYHPIKEKILKILNVSGKEAAIEVLKRLYFKDIHLDIPDIYLTNCDESFFTNYNGITIIGLNETDRAFIDLQTREVEIL